MNTPVALITGAGKGIGREAARLLASAGYHTSLVARTEPDLAETARLCSPSSLPRSVAPSLLLPTDISDPAAATLAVARTLEHFGRLDALVHCAGLAPQLFIEETSIEQWHRILDTNLSSAFYLAKAAWPAFKSQGGGAIVNISSEAARDPFPGFVAYGSAKAGLNLLGRSLAKEGAPHNIRAHTIAPAAVETQMFRELVTPSQWPPEKTLSPADVAKVILDCLTGPLQYTSGDVVWVHKTT